MNIIYVYVTIIFILTVVLWILYIEGLIIKINKLNVEWSIIKIKDEKKM